MTRSVRKEGHQRICNATYTKSVSEGVCEGASV